MTATARTGPPTRDERLRLRSVRVRARPTAECLSALGSLNGGKNGYTLHREAVSFNY